MRPVDDRGVVTDEDQIVQFGGTADPDPGLEIARGIGPVPEQAWNSVARPPGAPRDGCTSFVR